MTQQYVVIDDASYVYGIFPSFDSANRWKNAITNGNPHNNWCVRNILVPTSLSFIKETPSYQEMSEEEAQIYCDQEEDYGV